MEELVRVVVRVLLVPVLTEGLDRLTRYVNEKVKKFMEKP